MLTMLKKWQGPVEFKGQQYDTVNAFISCFKPSEEQFSIKLLPRRKNGVTERDTRVVDGDTGQSYRITVKKYMTEPSSPGFDFMAKWNNDEPMPMRTMVGTVDKETKGMVHMHLTGQGLETVTCMRCGKTLKNPISRHYGIGPECMQKLGFVCDIDAVDEIQEKLTEIEWTGWIIKSAILEQEEI